MLKLAADNPLRCRGIDGLALLATLAATLLAAAALAAGLLAAIARHDNHLLSNL